VVGVPRDRQLLVHHAVAVIVAAVADLCEARVRATPRVVAVSRAGVSVAATRVHVSVLVVVLAAERRVVAVLVVPRVVAHLDRAGEAGGVRVVAVVAARRRAMTVAVRVHAAAEIGAHVRSRVHGTDVGAPAVRWTVRSTTASHQHQEKEPAHTHTTSHRRPQGKRTNWTLLRRVAQGFALLFQQDRYPDGRDEFLSPPEGTRSAAAYQ
jgi:hypothetical protein